MKKLLILESLLVVCGLVFGVAAYFCLPEAQITQLQQYLLVQMQDLSTTATLSEATGRIFRANFMDFVRIYLAGLCLLGLPLLILFLFLKGFTFGFVVGFLAGHSPLLIFSRLLYYPVLIAAAACAIRFSLLLVQNRLSSPARQLVQYTVTFGLLLILALIFSYRDGFSCCHYLRSVA